MVQQHSYRSPYWIVAEISGTSIVRMSSAIAGHSHVSLDVVEAGGGLRCSQTQGLSQVDRIRLSHNQLATVHRRHPGAGYRSRSEYQVHDLSP